MVIFIILYGVNIAVRSNSLTYMNLNISKGSMGNNIPDHFDKFQSHPVQVFGVITVVA